MKIVLPCAVILSLGMSVGTAAAEMASSVITVGNPVALLPLVIQKWLLKA